MADRINLSAVDLSTLSMFDLHMVCEELDRGDLGATVRTEIENRYSISIRALIDELHRHYPYLFPERGEYPAVDALLDQVEQDLERALYVLRKAKAVSSADLG